MGKLGRGLQEVMGRLQVVRSRPMTVRRRRMSCRLRRTGGGRRRRIVTTVSSPSLAKDQMLGFSSLELASGRNSYLGDKTDK